MSVLPSAENAELALAEGAETVPDPVAVRKRIQEAVAAKAAKGA